MQTDGRITNLIPEAFIHFWIYIREIYLMKYMNYVTVIYNCQDKNYFPIFRNKISIIL